MDLVGKAAALFGSLPALMTPEETITYEECDRKARNIASLLLKKGLKPGDIVAVVSPNTPEMALLLFGLLKAGLIAAPLNCRFPRKLTADTIEALRPKLLITESDKPISLPGIGTQSIRSLIEESGTCPVCDTVETPENPDRSVTIIHTSASTGSPKAAVHSFTNHWYNALGSNDNIPFSPGDCWLLSLPFYHIGGYAVIFRALVSGASMAMGNPGGNISETLKLFPITHLSLVPTQLYRLLDDPESEALLRGMKAILLGGSHAPESLLEKALRLRIPLYLSYGSTEMGSQIATTQGPVNDLRQDSGHVLPFREVSATQEGELLVRGECLFSGYLLGGAVRPQTDAEGWFHTADIGQVSDDGLVTVFGRKDNMFISGGENIHPEEIEKALTGIRGISEAVVVPVPDEEYGHRPAAFIKPFGNEAPDDGTLDRLMKALVGTLKAPVRYVRVEAWEVLPGSQKTDRDFYRGLFL